MSINVIEGVRYVQGRFVDAFEQRFPQNRGRREALIQVGILAAGAVAGVGTLRAGEEFAPEVEAAGGTGTPQWVTDARARAMEVQEQITQAIKKGQVADEAYAENLAQSQERPEGHIPRPQTPEDMRLRYTPNTPQGSVQFTQLEVNPDGTRVWFARFVNQDGTEGRGDVFAGSDAGAGIQGWVPEATDDRCQGPLRQGKTALMPAVENVLMHGVSDFLIREFPTLDNPGAAAKKVDEMVGDTVRNDPNPETIIVSIYVAGQRGWRDFVMTQSVPSDHRRPDEQATGTPPHPSPDPGPSATVTATGESATATSTGTATGQPYPPPVTATGESATATSTGTTGGRLLFPLIMSG